ncbi:DUF320 domain-containing protein [Frankia sp. Ag45/Mut15]|uniref:DUF320 domain-containing protein n=1 Tax=Frankia umida TaxID=573489 RepID=A0ABT0JZY2_9ACTN|nr:chaplin family protein [Frankia umida]MCK9876792.1 DUF320 domain-containing protein [Frankia umida]
MSRSLITRPRLLVAAAALAVTTAVGGTAFAADSAPENVGETSPRTSAAAAVSALPVDAPRFAVVNAAGQVVRGSAGTSAGLTSGNNVEVLFDRDVRACAYTATVGGVGTESPAASFIRVAQRSGKPNGVFVSMKSGSQASVVVPFHLAVTC